MSDIEGYITEHCSAVPENLNRLYRQTYLTRLYPHMCCEPAQGRLLKMLVQMVAPRRILELGAFSGYSTLCLAEGAPEDAEVHTVEINDEYEDALRQAYEQSPYGGKVRLHIGDAMKVVPAISSAPWDLIYIDANKRDYTRYYELVKPLLRVGGYILADNTLWGGKVYDESAHDAQTEGIRRFNDLVAADEEVEQVIIPIRDGLTIIRKL